MEKIKVLVVDDSAFMRKIIHQMLEESKEIEVIGTAKDGKEALKFTIQNSPDVITLDIEMPGMNGLQTLKYIMEEKPTPVIMLSAYTKKGAEETMQALEYGAFDFVCKPSGEISPDIKSVQNELVEKIKLAKSVDIKKLKFFETEKIKIADKEKKTNLKTEVIVIIAASTGGPKVLSEIIPKLPRNLNASFLIVQHMAAGFTTSLANRLDQQSLIDVKEAEQGDIIEPGKAYLAPGDFHMEISRENEKYKIELNQKPQRLGVRPCADITIFSVVKNFDGKVICVILTGMGKDGTAGAEKIKEKNGIILAQDKETSIIFGMPKTAIDKGVVDKVLPVDKIADEIVVQIKNLLRN